MGNEMKDAYMEIDASVVDRSFFQKNYSKLTVAMQISEVRSFGWPIGLVLDRHDDYRPKPFDGGIEAVIKTDESFDNWSLTTEGDLYILKSLFEVRRNKSSIYIDTRLIRQIEAIARIACLYHVLGVSHDKEISIKIKLGGLREKILSIANVGNFMPPVLQKVCHVESFEREIRLPLSEIFDFSKIKDIAYAHIYDLGQLFDMHQLSRDVADKMITLSGVEQGVKESFNQGPLS